MLFILCTLCSFPWDNYTIWTYLLSLVVRLSSSTIYFIIVYAQVGFIVGFFFYFECFVEDIQYQLKDCETKKGNELERNVVDILKFHLSIIR